MKGSETLLILEKTLEKEYREAIKELGHVVKGTESWHYRRGCAVGLAAALRALRYVIYTVGRELGEK